MNFNEIVALLDQKGIDKSDFGSNYVPWSTYPEFGNVKCVEEYGGEGQGDRVGTVMFFEDHNVYINLEGYYQSYDGSDFSYAKYKEVTPKTKTITVYE